MYNKIVKFTVGVLLFLSPSVVRAGTIEISAYAANILNPDNSLASIGDFVQVGTFTPGLNFSTITTFSSLSANFTSLASCVIGAGGYAAGQFDVSVPYTSGPVGAQLYMWLFNSSIPANATAWAIVTNTSTGLWVTPPLGPSGYSATEVSDLLTYVPTGAAGTVLSNGGDIKMALIPEPTSFAMLGSGLLMMGSMIRRRK